MIDLNFLLDKICLPMILIILAMIVGRFLWRVCFFGAGIRLETDLRNRMFDRSKELSHQYYQVNKVGNLMSLYTNDLDTVQECFGWGIMMFFDALLLGVLAIIKMWRLNNSLTLLSCLPLWSTSLFLLYLYVLFQKGEDFIEENYSYDETLRKKR